MAGIRDAGFTDCTQVQADTFVHTLAGRDVFVQSQTGTGKTAVFLLTIYHHLLRARLPVPEARPRRRARRASWPCRSSRRRACSARTCPSRASSCTAASATARRKRRSPARSSSSSARPAACSTSRAATAGSTSGSSASSSSTRPTASSTWDSSPTCAGSSGACGRPRSASRCSSRATLSTNVAHLAWEHMNDPAEILVEPEQVTVETVDQELYHVSSREKLRLLLGLLAAENPVQRADLHQHEARRRRGGRAAAPQRLHGRVHHGRPHAEEAPRDHQPDQGRHAAVSRRHRRGGAGPAHQRPRARGELRPAREPRGLRAPHRPHRAAGQARARP